MCKFKFYFFLLFLSGTSIQALPRCEIRVKINPGQSSLSGSFRIFSEGEKNLLFYTDGLITDAGEGFQNEGNRLRLTADSGVINFKGKFPREKNDNSLQNNLISKQGIALNGNWHPQPEGLCMYRLSVELPESYTVISEADEVNVERNFLSKRTDFVIHNPLEKITIAASKDFTERKISSDGIEIYTYFRNENNDLSDEYLKKAAEYFKIYNSMIGPYPYKRFSIVENILPTGYSMPTYTLIGARVLRLPFILETSLGHEILHQWFGNSVYVMENEGNWSEGLTSYLADHLYSLRKGEDVLYRKNILQDYLTYASDNKELSPSEYKIGGGNKKERAVGYGKVLMFFHMLRLYVGDDVFAKSLRELYTDFRFKKTAYSDFKRIFEKYYGKDLSHFFNSWLNSRGLADFSIQDSEISKNSSGYKLKFSIVQNGDNIRSFQTHLSVYSNGKNTRYKIRVNEKSETYTIHLNEEPDRALLDEDFSIARRISSEEQSPRIADLLNGIPAVIVVPQGLENKYNSLSGYFPDVKISSSLEKSEYSKTIIIADKSSRYAPWFFSKTEQPDGDSLEVAKNPFSENNYTILIHANSEDSLMQMMKKISHYGKYSTVVFQDGKNILKETEKAADGLALDFSGNKNKSSVFPEVFYMPKLPDAVKTSKIIYIGESHNIQEHHEVQLEIIRQKFALDSMLSIGLEMFQIEDQYILDEYMSGKISERTFLKKSGYFEKWGYDFRLYRDILLFAKQNKIPVFALNQNSQIVKKVAKDGLEALNEAEKKIIPEKMDLSNGEYKQSLQFIFEQHGFSKKRFENFFTAQVLWDETMSEKIADIFHDRQNASIVVLAGSGHLKYGFGIPDRVFRRNGIRGKVVIQDEPIEKNISDFIIYNKNNSIQSSLFDGVEFKIEKQRISVIDIKDNSDFYKAGLRKGDILSELNDKELKSKEDFKIERMYADLSGKAVLKILREGMSLEITAGH